MRESENKRLSGLVIPYSKALPKSFCCGMVVVGVVAAVHVIFAKCLLISASSTHAISTYPCP